MVEITYVEEKVIKACGVEGTLRKAETIVLESHAEALSWALGLMAKLQDPTYSVHILNVDLDHKGD